MKKTALISGTGIVLGAVSLALPWVDEQACPGGSGLAYPGGTAPGCVTVLENAFWGIHSHATLPLDLFGAGWVFIMGLVLFAASLTGEVLMSPGVNEGMPGVIVRVVRIAALALMILALALYAGLTAANNANQGFAGTNTETLSYGLAVSGFSVAIMLSGTVLSRLTRRGASTARAAGIVAE